MNSKRFFSLAILLSAILLFASAAAAADVTLSGTFTGAFTETHTDIICDPNNTPVTLSGWVEATDLESGGAIMFGPVDQGLIDSGDSGWASGAYAYFGHIGSNIRIGPSDGYDTGGELNQVGANEPYVAGGPNLIHFTAEIFNGQITVTYNGTDYVDTYGEIEDAAVEDAYPGAEFDTGSYFAISFYPDTSSVDYDITVSGCTLLVTDDEGPVTTNVTANPNPIAVSVNGTVTAHVDDSNTGGSNIASAEYKLGGGTWAPMTAIDSSFDEVSEDVNASFTAPDEAGIYDFCVRGTDENGNLGAEECAMLVVYDPDGGFVTGGGWIDSPGGAYDGENTVRVDSNPDAGWAFNAEPPYVTPADFSSDEASIGNGSIHVEPITNVTGNDAKFILRYTPDTDILVEDFESFSVDFLVDDSGLNKAEQFYINFYTLTPDPNDGSWYDCRFDYIADSGSTTSWTSLSFAVTDTADAVGDKIGGTCPASPSGMPAGSTVLFISVNLGDTSANDTSVGGYFDNAQMSVSGLTTTWDFEEPLTGKANFGFVAKYKKGANVPMGNTEFVFKAGDLNFHSTSYDWLVVTGSETAKFKGEGTINGDNSPTGDPYKFQIWAQDASPDTFRIKIWYEDNGSETVVYDNGMNQPIGGGNIVVHKK